MKEEASDIVKWMMCSPTEGAERENFMELSEFEATYDTHKLNPRQRKADPLLCVKKYRRSAAGGGSGRTGDERILDVEERVEYLLKRIFCEQKSAHSNMIPKSLKKTATFVDDRLRAVQVDHTKLSNTKSKQKNSLRVISLSRMVRYYITVGYLMTTKTDNDANVSCSERCIFEHKFNINALQSTFSMLFQWFYVNDEHFTTIATSKHHVQPELDILDEMMSYFTLLRVCSQVLMKHDSERLDPSLQSMKTFHNSRCFFLMQAFLGMMLPTDLYLHYSSIFPFRRWKWSLQIAIAADTGNYVLLFQLLDTFDKTKEERWNIMCRCCLSSIIPIVRLQLLRYYNKSFAKGGKVSGKDIARLLGFTSVESSLSFCERVNIPLTENKDMVIFKVRPIETNNDDLDIMGRNDDYVFHDLSNHEMRVDDNNIRIPSPEYLWKLIG